MEELNNTEKNRQEYISRSKEISKKCDTKENKNLKSDLEKDFNNDFYMFGTGKLGLTIYEFFKPYVHIKGFIDNSKTKQGNFIDGHKIYAADVVKQNNREFKIIITTNFYYEEIKTQLEEMGLIHKIDFFYYKEFFQYIFYKTNILLQGYAEILITDRCTLKCKNCVLMVPYFPKKKDRPLEEIKEDVKAYFRIVDKVLDFRLLGGEPFLHKQIDEIITYIGQEYGDRIQQFKIASNGTVIPENSTLELIKKYKIKVEISDYDHPLTYKQREKLLLTFKEKAIFFEITALERWIDYFGDPHKGNGLQKQELKDLFRKCNFGCRNIYQKKLYYCAVDCAATRLGIVADSVEDYFDLKNMEFNAKEELLGFDSGDVKRGYVSFCRNCYGGLGCNRNFIKVAEQLKEIK